MAHRRRGVGVSRTTRNAKTAVAAKANELRAGSLQNAIDTVQKLEVKLTEFAKTNRTAIQNDPVFRQQFLQMCGPLGIDVLSSHKTTLGTLLGMGDFYHELAVKVAEVCLSTKPTNGGIISISEIQSKLSNRTSKLGTVRQEGKNTVHESDIIVAVEKLGKLGGGFRTTQVGGSSTNTKKSKKGKHRDGSITMVVSVPTELDDDHMTILTFAAAQQTLTNGILLYDIEEATGWNTSRTQRAIDVLLQQGMVWIDVHQGTTFYWFTSLWQERTESP